MIVAGFWALLLSGLLGAALHEGAKLFASWRTGRSPSGKEVVASVVVAAVGALVPLLYGLDPRPFLEAAQLGVGVPALISGGFRVGTSRRISGADTATGSRSVWEYLGWRA